MNNVLYFYLSIYVYLFVASLCYQIVHIDMFEEIHDQDFKQVTCSWKYFCSKQFHFCENGCSLKTELQRGYNLLNTDTLKNNCYFNIECGNYDVYFYSEKPSYIFFFSKPFFRISEDFTFYVYLIKQNEFVGKSTKSGINRFFEYAFNNFYSNKFKSYLLKFFKKINKYRKIISKLFKRGLIKLLFFLVLIHMIFFYLYIYTYLELHNREHT
ncbi:conserved protein, unknown function [Hepatocystis sp. ex Piliocolobus tephrosceles]|nr:conserved protein, unknown function [Hepatocystis sp. ex Piliocolobus tephrosceles]